MHYFLAPSSASLTIHCEAAPLLTSRYPEPDDDSTRAGSASHWAGAELFAGRYPRAGSLAPNGVILDQDMIDGAEMWYESVMATLSAFPNEPLASNLLIESPVVNDALHPTHNGGTPDSLAWRLGPAPLRYLFIDDYKYGHAVVEAFENWQMINYAALELRRVGANGLDDQNIYVQMRVIQPRAPHRDGPVRTWTVKASDLRPYFNRLAQKYAAATGADPQARPGEWCKTQYCSAARGCVALQRAASYVTQQAHAAQTYDTAPADAAIELRQLEEAAAIISARRDAVQEHVGALLRQGIPVPGYYLEAGRGSERIRAGEEAAFVAAAELYGVDVRKPLATITPLQARGKGVPQEITDLFSERRPGEMKVTRDDTLARRIFGKST